MLTPAQAAAIATSAFVRPAAPSALLAPPPVEGSAWVPAPAEDPEPDPPAPTRPRDDGADSPYRTVVDAAERDDELEAQRRLDAQSPGFATAVDLPHEPGTQPADGLPEVIARTPGATVRTIGGLGQYSAVSLRGSSAQQVAIFLDGVPLTSSVAGLVDLASIPLDSLARVEIYRGHVPVEFGSAAIGGAIDLVSAPAWRRGSLSLHGGYGSFGTRESRLSLRGPLGRRGRSAGSIVVGYAGTTGDFPLVDVGARNLADDRVVRRTNNDYDRVALHARFDHRRGPWRLAVQELVQYKDQGIPGPAGSQTRRSRLGTVMSRTTASVLRHGAGGPGGRLEWKLGGGLLHQTYADPDNEVGLAQNDQRLLGADLYLSPRLRLPLWRDAYLGLVADQRIEVIDVDERLALGPQGDARRSRLAWGTGIELEQFLFDDRWLLVPVLRVDGLLSRFATPPGTGEQDDQGRDRATLGLAPRVGTRLRLWPGVELRASGGRYFRPPTLTELFGDRGYIVGNEGLAPERGQSLDGGLVLDRRLLDTSVYAQLAGFHTWSDDLIQWVTAGSVNRPINVAGARLRGVESALTLIPARRWLTLAANYTFLDTRNDSDDPGQRGRPLPGRPRHELFARVSASRSWPVGAVLVSPRVLYMVDVITGTTIDTQGRLPLPPRALQGAGVELDLDRRVHLAFEVRNLLDVRTAPVVETLSPFPVSRPISDFIAYPLPGRSLWGSLRIELEGRP